MLGRLRFSRQSFAVLSAVLYGVVWLAGLIDWNWLGRLPNDIDLLSPGTGVNVVYAVVFFASLPIGLAALLWTLWPVRRRQLLVFTVATLFYIPWWQAVVFLTEWNEWANARGWAVRIGIGGLFLIGLFWLVWGLEQAFRRYEFQRRQPRRDAESNSVNDDRSVTPSLIWNPLNLAAWYYGNRQQRLNQSVMAFVSYSLLFLLVFLVLTRIGGCGQEEFLLPGGGGEQAQLNPPVKIQRVIVETLMFNPASLISLNADIEKVKLNITEITRHLYTVGYGKGTGAGFSGGDTNAKVRFIRLEYEGGDWDLGMGVGADMNLLDEFGKIAGYENRIAKKTESIRIRTLFRKYKATSSPPLLFITGMGRLSLPKRDQRLLREYLLERHGMIFASAGSAEFDRSFLSLMHELFPKVREVPVPLDDPIHKHPYQIPSFPYVAPHGGKQAIGWKVDGRWIAYYHPGDIVDAWRNDHAGVRRNIWIACYQLGMNVIFYAYRENAIWRSSQKHK